MQKFTMEPLAYNIASAEILSDTTLTFEENLIAADSDGCSPYGCTCIAYERCCGCLLQ